MADTQVLGTCVFGRAGSSPASRTNILDMRLLKRGDNFLKLTGMRLAMTRSN